MKIASWNVNSLRVRLPQVLEWLQSHSPDILGLQETKLQDEQFPVEEFRAAGYHAEFAGQKTYNGVAVLSREPACDVIRDIPELDDAQRRVLGVTCAGLRVLNLYVPNGQSVTSEKYVYKLRWLERLTEYVKAQSSLHPRLVLIGDFNIAPAPIDVHDPEAWEGKVLFSEPERAAFTRLLEAGGLRDVFREQHPDEQAFTWWDYRVNAFRRNLGLRIDHVLASQALYERCGGCIIDIEARRAERPSDHAPIMASFDL
jgi:exodeoxyribonuclease-3